MDHEELDMREVRPDEEVLHVLTPEQAADFKKTRVLREKVQELKKQIESTIKRHNAQTTLLWEDIYEVTGEEEDDDQMVICSRGDEFVVVMGSNVDEDRNRCDCPICKMKRSGVPDELINMLRNLLGGGDH